MNILVPKFSMRARMNALWAAVVGTWIAPYLTHEAQGLSALTLVKQFPTGPDFARMLAQGWYDRPLQGAGYGWESRYPLPYDPTGTLDVDLSGANSVDMMILDYVTIMEIGCAFTVAGTTTLLVMDFDHYTRTVDAAGTLTDKLDWTNGVITAGAQASQAAGVILFKDLGNTLGGIDKDKGGSVRAIVTTTVTAGEGVPYVLVVPRAMNNANLDELMFASA